MKITNSIFEAGLKCFTKGFLLSSGHHGVGNAYSDWIGTTAEFYRKEGAKQLIERVVHDDRINRLSRTVDLKTATWQMAVDVMACAHDLESNIHAVERVPADERGKSPHFIPFRFIFSNKLTRDDKLLLAFDSLVLSEMLGREVSLGKIIHGDNHSTLKIKTPALMKEVRKLLRHLDAVLSSQCPPDLFLKRHCGECEFQSQCRQTAIEKDDLSLLSGMTEKERRRYNNKGIFTATQLSYTFRPRRRLKRLRDKREKYHHSLKALAIREKKIHIVGNPELKIDGTPVYLDVECLPDRNFFYLIGIRLEDEKPVPRHHSLWADTPADEERIWNAFLDILSEIDKPVLIHFGGFETMFLKKMCNRYGGPPEDSATSKSIVSSINLLSVIFGQIYFPTYSNGLKEIARFLGFEWTEPLSSGLQSIAWRHQWEESHASTIREQLITYNGDDCKALGVVARTLSTFAESGIGDLSNSGSKIVYTESMTKTLTSKWRMFKSPLPDLEQINVAAHWNYQRDRVFVRSGIARRKKAQQHRRCRPGKRVEKVFVLKAPALCPACKKKWRRKGRLLSRTVQDLIFGRDSLKRRVVQYIVQTYRCRSCALEYGLHEWYHHGRKWGWNVVAYFVYSIVGLRIPQLTVQHSLNRLFGFSLGRSTLNNLKTRASEYYSASKRNILQRIIRGNLIHADETQANIKGHRAYVWVLTNLCEVVYILSESREGEIVQEILKGFKGVLMTDFYTAYDSIECPQQKCLIHLMRDLNDEMLNNPFNEEIKSIVAGFGALLKPIIATVDLRGLKRVFLQKHLREVDRFYRFLDKADFKSEPATKCKQRFMKYRDRLWTFLSYDGVPWNNNNAEHAIKAFARLRDVISGLSTRKGVDEYLTLLSLAETCEYQGLDFLAFLCSGEKDIETFAEGKKKAKRRL